MSKSSITGHKILLFLRWLVIVLFLTLVLLEAVLQVAALFANKKFVEKRQTSSSTLLPDSKLRVVMMGDSNTYGLYLKAEESYPAVFQAEWNVHHPDNKIEVINLGFPGTNSSRVLKSLPEVIKTFSPDVITVMVGVNDFWMAPVNVDGVASPVSPVEGWLRDHSRTYKLIYMLHRQFYSADQLVVDDEYRNAKYEDTLRLQKDWSGAVDGQVKSPFSDKPAAIHYGDKVFDIGYIFSGKINNPAEAMQNNMLKMADIAEASGVKLVFITYAYFEMPQKAANQQMKVAAKSKKNQLINVTKTFRDNCAMREARCKELFFPDYHPTAEGYRLLASEIEKVFLNSDSVSE